MDESSAGSRARPREASRSPVFLDEVGTLHPWLVRVREEVREAWPGGFGRGCPASSSGLALPTTPLPRERGGLASAAAPAARLPTGLSSRPPGAYLLPPPQVTLLLEDPNPKAGRARGAERLVISVLPQTGDRPWP